MGASLVFDRVSVAYGRAAVLHEVSATMEPGRMVAVTGPSGAGKSSLLCVAAGLVAPSAGQVTVGGVPLRDRDYALAAQVVLVPQDNGLAPVLTAQENIQVALLANGVVAPTARQRSLTWLEAVGLGEQAGQLVEELSGGQAQRAAVARGLALGGSVLLADEVTSELDAPNRLRVMDLLREQARRGAVVLFATHDPEAAAACDGELRLRDGRADVVR